MRPHPSIWALLSRREQLLWYALYPGILLCWVVFGPYHLWTKWREK